MMKELKLRNDSEEIWVLEFTPEAAQEFRDRVMEESKENPNKPIVIYILRSVYEDILYQLHTLYMWPYIACVYLLQ